MSDEARSSGPSLASWLPKLSLDRPIGGLMLIVTLLVLGVVAGRLIPFPPAFRDQPAAASGPTSAAVVATDLGEPTSYGAEDDFLVEIEAALGNPRIYELRAIDAMTPRIREVAVNIR